MRLRLPTRTIRLRLTLIYGAVFLVSAVALLTLGYLLVRHNLHHHHRFRNDLARTASALLPVDTRRPGPAIQPAAVKLGAARVPGRLSPGCRHGAARLLLEYIGALVVMTGVSVALGWWMAGRALAPLRGDHRHRAACLGREPRRADRPAGTGGRAQGAGRHLRRHAHAARRGVREPAALRRQRLARAAHAAGDHAHRGRRRRSRTPMRASASCGRWARRVRETIDRSESLIAALLFLARSEGVRGREEPVDLAELAGGCITDLHRSAEAAGITHHRRSRTGGCARRLRAARANARQPRGERDPSQPGRRRAQRRHLQLERDGGGAGPQRRGGDRSERGAGADRAVPASEPHRRRLRPGALDRPIGCRGAWWDASS